MKKVRLASKSGERKGFTLLDAVNQSSKRKKERTSMGLDERGEEIKTFFK